MLETAENYARDGMKLSKKFTGQNNGMVCKSTLQVVTAVIVVTVSSVSVSRVVTAGIVVTVSTVLTVVAVSRVIR